MFSTDETLLCRYHYDPLDRLAACTPLAQARTQRFYLKERLTSEIQGSVRRSIFQQDDQLLAQQQRQDSVVETHLLATDQQRSVLHALDAIQPHPLTYTPYGHRPLENGLFCLLGFNGEQPDPVTGHYLLGIGYRAFNSVLMRFNSPDSLSPFGEGGLNAYTYCLGDPVNQVDPTGHLAFFWKSLGSFANIRRSSIPRTNLRFDAAMKTPSNITGVLNKTETSTRAVNAVYLNIDQTSSKLSVLFDYDAPLVPSHSRSTSSAPEIFTRSSYMPQRNIERAPARTITDWQRQEIGRSRGLDTVSVQGRALPPVANVARPRRRPRQLIVNRNGDFVDPRTGRIIRDT